MNFRGPLALPDRASVITQCSTLLICATAMSGAMGPAGTASIFGDALRTFEDVADLSPGSSVSIYLAGQILGASIVPIATRRLSAVVLGTGAVAANLGGLVICVLATSMAVFSIGRAIEGAGVAMLYVVLVRAIGMWNDEKRVSVLAFVSLCSIVGLLLGPAIATSVASAVGWRYWVGLVLILNALFAPACVYVLRSSLRACGSAVVFRGRWYATWFMTVAAGVWLAMFASDRITVLVSFLALALCILAISVLAAKSSFGRSNEKVFRWIDIRPDADVVMLICRMVSGGAWLAILGVVTTPVNRSEVNSASILSVCGAYVGTQLIYVVVLRISKRQLGLCEVLVMCALACVVLLAARYVSPLWMLAVGAALSGVAVLQSNSFISGLSVKSPPAPAASLIGEAFACAAFLRIGFDG